MSEEKNGRYYKESSEKLALKIGINRATRSGTKAPYGTAGCKERRRLPLHRNILETNNIVVCYNIYGTMYTSGVIIVFGFTEISAL